MLRSDLCFRNVRVTAVGELNGGCGETCEETLAVAEGVLDQTLLSPPRGILNSFSGQTEGQVALADNRYHLPRSYAPGGAGLCRAWHEEVN